MPSSDPQQVVTKTPGWAGGLNIRDAINEIDPTEVRIAENGILDEKGGFSKRLGTLSHGTFGTGTDRVLSCYTFYRGTSAPQVLIHTTGGKLYYTNDPTASPITWTQIATGLSTTQPFSYETFNSKCYFSNGIDSYASWDGATYTTFGSAPKGRFLRLYKDTMWVSGIDATPDRVWSSNAGDAETFGVASWVDIAHGDGDKVTALATDGLFLIVFKRNRTFIIYDPALFSNRVLDFEKGCESHFSVIQFESDIYFLSRRGVCVYNQSGPSDFISIKLDPLFDPQVLNLNALNTAYAYTIGTRVGWALPEVGQTMPSMQIEMYPRLRPISQYGFRGLAPWVTHRIPATSFTRFRSGAVEYLFGGASAANKFYEIFAAVGTDDGVTFTALMETGPYDFNQPTRTKYIRRLRVLGRGQVSVVFKRNYQTASYKTFPIDLSSAADLWSLGDLWGAGAWGPDAVVKEKLVNPDAYARFFSFRFTDSSTNTGRKLVEVGSSEYSLTSGEWAVYGMVLEADVLGVRD